MTMSLARKSVTIAGILALVLAMPLGALAQAKQAVKPAASSAASASWTCVSRARVEIAPVSFDTYGTPEAWVVVHRVNGEVIAAERVSLSEIEKLRRLPCGTPDSDQGGVAVG